MAKEKKYMCLPSGSPLFYAEWNYSKIRDDLNSFSVIDIIHHGFRDTSIQEKIDSI